MMRNKFAGQCHYCHSDVKEGEADTWKWNGRWYLCCDKCKASNPKQVAAAKRQKAQKQDKSSKKAQPKAKVSNPEQLLASLSKEELVALILGKK